MVAVAAILDFGSTWLANFDPEVVLLLQSKFQLISTKGLGTVIENGFQDGGRGNHFQSARF